MNEVLKTFLSLSLSGALLVLLLFLCKPFLKDRISKRWQYYIWLVVIGRLLLPFAPETNFVGTVFQMFDRAALQTAVAAFPMSGGDAPAPWNAAENAVTLSDNPAVRDVFVWLGNNLWLVWLIAALVLIIRRITVYQSFVRYIKAGQTPVSDTELLDRMALIGEEAGVKRAVDLCVNPLISSPLLIGFFRPCIVLPGLDISKTDFRYTILHELTHYRRRDMLYKWLAQFTICLHWFNPLVYLMGRELNRMCEFSCDEAIIAKLKADDIRDYGKTLLNAMAAVGKYKEALASVTLSENKALLKERLGAIMKYKTPSKALRLFTAVLTLALCFGAAFTGAYAAGIPKGTVPENTEIAQSDTITAAQADEMALALTNKMWVWDWVAFFVPYMSENGVSQIVSTSESSEWAGTLDYSAMTPMKPFTQTQVDNARKIKPEKAFLTKSDIDAHAQMIMQSNGQWSCVDFMLPYMTDNGVRQVQFIYGEKHGGLPPIVNEHAKEAQDGNHQTQPETFTKDYIAGSQTLNIMRQTGDWG